MIQTLVSNPDDVDQAVSWSLSSDPNTVAQAMYEILASDLRDDLATIKVPTLVLGSWVAYQPHGATKESTSAIFQSQYDKLSQLRFEISETGRHFIMLDDPEFLRHHIDQHIIR